MERMDTGMGAMETIHLVTEGTRSKIIKLLFEHHYCVNALAHKLGISAPAVSQHIKLLKRYGIVTGTRISYQMHYRVNKGVLEEAFQQLLLRIGSYRDTSREGLDDCTCEFSSLCKRYEEGDLKAARKG